MRKTMQCFCSGEPVRGIEMVPTEFHETGKDYSASVQSSLAGETERKLDAGNIEEAEILLRESGSLNYEVVSNSKEARALLGRYEYQKGNIEAALHVFEGIDITAVTLRMKITLSKKGESRKRHSQNYDMPPMSIHAVSLLLESIFLKAKSYQSLGRYKDSAQSCSVILDIVESSLPAGLPENFGADCKLQETLNRAVELLPELWKLSGSDRDAILSYRRALLYHWNLDAQTTAAIQKEFAIFLLYSGAESVPPSLKFQIDNSFIPNNNREEAILLLIILLRKVSLKRIEWDPSILDHLSYALSSSGGLRALANQVEELLPGYLNRNEMYHILALCYHAEGDDLDAIELWKKLLRLSEDTTNLQSLLFVSKICSGRSNSAQDGIDFSRKALEKSDEKCDQLTAVANCTLGLSLSTSCSSVVAEVERVERKSEALKSLEISGKITKMNNPDIVYHICLENAEQRKLDEALCLAKHVLELEGGYSIRGWILLGRILSGHKRFSDAETVINAALDQTGVWDQRELFRTKAKLQIAQGRVKDAIESYSQIFAVLQVQKKNFGSDKKHKENINIASLELETWLDLALIYIKLSRWQDAELCLSKADAITAFSASRWHATGLLNEAKGEPKEALKAYEIALQIDSVHVQSLVSMGTVLKTLGCYSPAIVRSFLTEAIRLDRMNYSAWHNLGLLYKDERISSAMEAADCFQAAIFLEETEPVEPFR